MLAQPLSESILTISELNRRVSEVMKMAFPVVAVKGEISNLKIAASGHVYFTLKDNDAQLSAMLFRSSGMRLRFQPENGLEVIASGEIGLYEKRGEFRLIVQSLEPAGIGALQLAFEQLKRRLEAEGLFDASARKELPLFPRRIGIVTSPAGAAVRDILNVLSRRMPSVQVILAPVPVQGDDAAPAIAVAISDLNALGNIDLLIVGRGGGSIEDLWAFNEEIVARAIAASAIPVISAVGHETDFTIADFAADLRAPTPSAAAELAVPDREDLRLALELRLRRLTDMVQAEIALRASAIALLAEGYVMRRFPERLMENVSQVEAWLESARNILHSSILERERRLASAAGRLEALSPMAVLGRGYAILRCADSRRVIMEAGQVTPGERVEIVIAGGLLKGEIMEVCDEGCAG